MCGGGGGSIRIQMGRKAFEGITEEIVLGGAGQKKRCWLVEARKIQIVMREPT